ncbi:9844_t:CDS:2 [Racocetra fulgida]|uniref:9844_t:CDS:1 n=1 Tax=Racocetra fulgida TaxID=60492 RepID=A0A9N9B0Q3_9GLOM|nr:9844_t:CDS:2 [Racocetra fulgida]
MILPDDMVLSKPPPQPDFATRDNEDESSISVDDVDEEEILQLDVVTDFMSTKNDVTDIVDINISQLAKSTKNKEKLTALKRATLRYCISGLIDLLAHMRNWFSANDLEFMKKDFKPIIKPPDFEEEVDVFITEVEKAENAMLVRFMSNLGIDLGEWEFSAYATPAKAIEDRCRFARINQFILNGMLKLDLSDEQTKIVKVPFLQIAGAYGQVLLEDLVNGFYVVIPGLSFELPTKLSQIQKLRPAETYEEIGNMLDGLDYGPNKLDRNHGGRQKQKLHLSYQLKFKK